MARCILSFIAVLFIYSAVLAGDESSLTVTSSETVGNQDRKGVPVFDKEASQSAAATTFDQIMSKWVGSFLIVGMIIGVLTIFIVFIGGIQGFFRTFLCIFIALYCYLLLNYALWFFSGSYSWTIRGFIFSGIIFLFIPLIKIFFKIREKGEELLISRSDWTCPQCQIKNRYSQKCWNCSAERSAVSHP